MSVDDSQEQLDSFMAENPMPFINCRTGRSSRILHELGINNFPACILIDKYGVIRSKGRMSKALLMDAVTKLAWFECFDFLNVIVKMLTVQI